MSSHPPAWFVDPPSRMVADDVLTSRGLYIVALDAELLQRLLDTSTTPITMKIEAPARARYHIDVLLDPDRCALLVVRIRMCVSVSASASVSVSVC